MLPIGDENPTRIRPIVNWSIIVICIIVYIWQTSGSLSFYEYTVYTYGIIPNMDLFGSRVYTLMTNMFLHTGWSHLMGNLMFLWIFGDNIEDCCGHLKYLGFYLASGIGASLLHVASDPHSTIPTIGASGAIAGVMGAYFVLYPRARVTSVVILIYFIRLMEIPAVVFLGIWFLIQIFSGVASIGADAASGGVAFWAHVGGFIVGLAGGGLARLMTKDPTKGRVEVITKDGKRYLH